MARRQRRRSKTLGVKIGQAVGRRGASEGWCVVMWTAIKFKMKGGQIKIVPL